MGSWADIRREYGTLSLEEGLIAQSPIAQFKLWFSEILTVEKTDPTAMVLATVDSKGRPDSRVVLLKELNDEGFIFYTNYCSAKAKQLNYQPYAAITFYWSQMARQVRVRGKVKRISQKQSDDYFASRPLPSKLSAIISNQSQAISDRHVLEAAYSELLAKSSHTTISRPEYWGGYLLIPQQMEFWQGRDNRLHDRIYYYKKKGQWVNCRLAP